MTEISLSGRGARGESQADILRRTGQFGVLPTDTDAEAVGKLNADAALSAAAAETASGPVYASTAAGIAATVDGEYFAVDAGAGSIAIYLNDTEVAVLQRTMATTQALAASTGAGLVGFTQSGTGAVTRTVESKLRDTVNPKDFGAVGDGVADDGAELLLALQSGRVVDLGGATYATSVEIAPVSFVGIQNGKLKWTDVTAMAQQKALLALVDLSNWFVDNVEFDMGTVENTGSADDSSRRGLKVTTSSPNVTFNTDISVKNCLFYGYGNGTRLYVRSCKRGVIANNIVRDSQVAYSPDPTNDCQNGIDISQSVDMTVSGNVVYNLKTRLSGTLQKRYSRGLLFFELSASTITGNVVDTVDQAFDFSGAVDAVTNPEGNRDLAITGNTAANVYTYGFKFANVIRDSMISGNSVRAFGLAGYVFSGSYVAPYDVSKNTQRLLVSGNSASNPTGEFSANNRGFWIVEQPASVGYPRGITLVGNSAYDDTGGGFLLYCYSNEPAYAGSNMLNELIGCRGKDYVTAFSTGFQQPYCKVTGTGAQSIPDAAATVILWDDEVQDAASFHSTSSSTEQVQVPVPGWYRVTATGQFASNATGYRRMDVLVNGAQTAGGTVCVNAVNGDVTALSTSLDVYLLPSQNVRVEVTQNSGGALNFNRLQSALSLDLLEAA